MAKLRSRTGEIIHYIDFTQREINAIFYALEAASENEDTYDVETHDCLEEFFGALWVEGEEEEEDSEEGPEAFSGYLTTTSVRDSDTQDTVLDFSEALARDRESHGIDEDY